MVKTGNYEVMIKVETNFLPEKKNIETFFKKANYM